MKKEVLTPEPKKEEDDSCPSPLGIVALVFAIIVFFVAFISGMEAGSEIARELTTKQKAIIAIIALVVSFGGFACFALSFKKEDDK